MASALPSVPVPLATEAAKFKPRVIMQRGLAPSKAPGPASPSRPYTSAAAAELGLGMVQYGTRQAVPPLTLLALEALVAGFEKRPTLRGIPPRFADAVAMKLPVSLDVRLTAPAIEEETYWKRVCLEERGYSKAEVTRHGGSWKRLCLELFIAELLERFGLYPDLPPGFEDEFCRPPLDSTHPHWATQYPKVAALREDGRPRKERIAANVLAEPRSDLNTAHSGESGWPHFEHLKELARAGLSAYAKAHAWASVDKTPFLPRGDGEGSGAAAGGPASGAGASAGSSGAASAGGVPNRDLYLLPFAVASERLKAVEEAERQRQDDAGDCAANGAQCLREFVPPEGVDTFKRTGRWPPRRCSSLLALRQGELDALLERLVAAGGTVRQLEVEQLPSHVDLELVFSRLPRLEAFKLSYGMRHLGMRFERSLFGMRPADAESLSRCLRYSESLRSLSLPSNMIDDNLLLLLCPGLLDNRALRSLDLSHNLITSAGLQQLCKKLRAPCTLSVLNLSDNKIDERGGRYLGRALRGNDGVTELRLRLNELGDDGGRAVLEGLREHRAVRVLDLSSNKLASASAATLGQLLAAPGCALASVDVSGNRLDESDAAVLQRAVAGNEVLTSLDMRGNAGIADKSESVQSIFARTRGNEVRMKLATELGMTGGDS